MRTRFTIMVSLFTLTAAAWPVAAQVSCNPMNDCMTNAVCQADGSCQGAPKANGSSCDPSALSGDCATSGTCLSFTGDGVSESICMPSDAQPDGTACMSPTLSALGPCVTSAACKSGYCKPLIKTCSQPTDKCMNAFCNPSNGQCQTVANTCQDACSTGTCDPSTGNCINMQPTNEGLACAGQGNPSCPSNSQCHNGQCTGSGGGTPVPSATPTNTAELPPTPTPVSPTPAAAVCTGDCGGTFHVAVNDIIILVNIVLGNQQPAACAHGIPPGVPVDITVIIQAVNNALNDCPTPPASTPTNSQGPATPTNTPLAPTPSNTQVVPTNTPVAPTPTNTQPAPTPTGSGSVTITPAGVTPTPTPSATPAATVGGYIAARATGGAQSTIKAFLAIPDLLSAFLGHALPMSVSAGSAASLVNFTITCPAGGGGTFSCDQSITPPTLGPPTYSIALNSCVITDAFGTTHTFNGTVSAMGQSGDLCTGVPASPTLSIQNLTVTTAGSAGTRTATFTNFTATASFTCSSGSCQCTYDTLDMTVSGTVAVTSQGAAGQTSSTQATFSGTQLSLSVGNFGDQCLATNYSLVVDGNVTLNTDGQPFAGVFSSYELDDDATSGDDMVTVTGDVTSTCLGHDVSVSTNTPLDVPQGAVCPNAGELEFITSGTGQDDLVDYTGGGAVAIDLNNDGTIDFNYVSCIDPQFLVCPAN